MKKSLIFYLLLAIATFLLFTSCSKQECKLPPTKETRIIASQPIYYYPYKDLDKELKDKNITSLKLFVYGSLMNPESRKKTLAHNDLSQDRLAIAFGMQRLFNLDVPYKNGSNWGALSTPSSRGRLNVKITGNTDEFINGIVIDVPLEDLAALSEREEFYNLVPILTADWDAFLHGKLNFSTAYTLIAPGKPGITSNNILPRNGYFEFTRAAASAQGICFEEFWLNTTYLSDGVTPVSDWLKTSK